MTGRLTLGVDIGGTKTLAALVADDGAVVDMLVAATPATAGGTAVVGAAIDLARRLVGSRTTDAIGVGAAGVIDSATGTVLSSTDAVSGWRGTNILGAVTTAFPGVPATVVNDVQAFASGELQHGAGRGAASLIAVTVGTGIGGAFIVNGRPVLGSHSAAGHIGHVVVPGAEGELCPCGRTGHLEAIASGPAMTEACRRRGLQVDDLRAVALLATNGNPVAKTALDSGARALGLAIGSLVNALDPEVVVIGGGVAELGDRWLGLVASAAQDTCIPAVGTVRIERGTLGAAAVAVGAAGLASHIAPGADTR